MADRLTRIAIVNEDKCKPKKCGQECKKSCPVVRMGKFVQYLEVSNYFIVLYQIFLVSFSNTSWSFTFK